MNKHWLFFFLFLLPWTSYAQARLEKGDNELWLSDKMEVYTDNDNTLTIENVEKAPFKKMKSPLYSFGLNSAKAYWLKIEVDNQSQQHDWLLTVDFAQHTQIDIYTQNEDGTWKTQNQGFALKYYTRPIFHNFFAFPIELKQKKTIYLRISTDRTCIFPISLVRVHTFIKNKAYLDIYYGIYIGIFLGLLAYNIFLWLGLRDKTYFYYVVALLSSLCMNVSNSGHTFQFLLPDNPVLGRYAIEVGSALLATSAALFARSFLNIRAHSLWLDYMLIGIAWAGIGLFLALLFLPVVWVMHGLYNLLSIEVIILLASGIVSWRKNNKYAAYYVLAWIGYLIGGIFRMWADQGILPWNMLTHHAAEIGSALEAMLLSIALSSRYNAYKKENENAIKKALEIEKEANETLEKKVQERTLQLKEANNELGQTNEELQSALELLNEQKVELVEKNNNITASITYAQRIQEAMLPSPTVIAQGLGKENFFVLYKPLNIVSGDFYFFEEITLADKKLLFIAVADCTGHGVPGAFMSMIGNQILHETISKHHIYEPAKILEQTHTEIRRTLHQDTNESRDGMDMVFVTIEVAPESIILSFAGAMNPLYIIQNQAIQKIKGTKKPIGGRQDEPKRVFETFKTSILYTPTYLYLCTDGYADQFGGSEKKKYSSNSLKDFLLAHHQEPMETQKNKLQKNIEAWMLASKEKQIDDITIFGIKIT